MERHDVIVVGAGLSGLSCAFELCSAGRDVLLLEAKSWVGGRTASWTEKGMELESGLHRFRGIYRALPALLSRAGLDIDAIVEWHNRIEVRVPGLPPCQLGIAPRFDPRGAFITLLGKHALLPLRDRLSLLPTLVSGLLAYRFRPRALEEEAILALARQHGLSPLAVERFLLPLSRGVFFRAPDDYSALAFMMPLAQSLRHLLRMRTGVFKGGMTDVMARPLAEAICKMGGTLRTEAPVRALRFEAGRVSGVELEGESMLASAVVLAVPLGCAQGLLSPFISASRLAPLLSLPSTPAVTLQMDLQRPALLHSQPVFAPASCAIVFAEQSSSTFPQAKGRLSLVLSEPERFISLPDDLILQEALESLQALGLDLGPQLQQYGVVRYVDDFYSVSPGNAQLRPTQATDIPGLILAGDYTEQPFLSTMEGAVIAGGRAAKIALQGNQQ